MKKMQTCEAYCMNRLKSNNGKVYNNCKLITEITIDQNAMCSFFKKGEPQSVKERRKKVKHWLDSK